MPTFITPLDAGYKEKAMDSNNRLRMAFVLPSASLSGKSVTPSHHPIMTATFAAVARRAGAEVMVIGKI